MKSTTRWLLIALLGLAVVAAVFAAALTSPIRITGERQITDDSWDSFQWSPDGSKLLLSRVAYQTSTTGQEPEISESWQSILDVKTGDVQVLPEAGIFALWSPDGQMIFVASDESLETGDQGWIYRLEDGSIRPITNYPKGAHFFAWTDEGIVYMADDGLWLTRPDDEASSSDKDPGLELGPSTQLLAYDTHDPALWSYPSLDLSAFLLSDNTDLARRQWWLVQRDGSSHKMDASLYGLGICCRWSPDSSHLAYFALENGEQYLYLVDKLGDNPEILVSSADLGEGAFLSLDFSPDGQTLVFVYAPQGAGFPFEANSIYSVGVDGHGLKKLGNQTDHPYNWLRWSPDGRHIAFRDAGRKIWVAEIH